MNIYLATPVNGRKEKTLKSKQIAAKQRVEIMAVMCRRWYRDAEFTSAFDYVEPGVIMLESVIMGHCVKMVMECDMIILDDGWEDSRGCTVERFVAMQYGKKVQTMNYLMLKDKIG